MSYCTVDEAKRYLGIAETNTNDDRLLSELVVRATGIIETATQRNFEAEADSTRYLHAWADVDGYDLIFGADCCSITSVTNGDNVVVSASEYTTKPRNETPYYGIRLLSSANKSWTYTDDPEDAIEIVGRWGYSISAPWDINHAAVRLASALYRQKDNANDLDRAIVVSSTATVLPASIPADVMEILKPYVRRVA